MGYTIERTKSALISKLDANEWNTISILVKATGDYVMITPCSQMIGNITCEKECEFFLLDCDSVNLVGANTLDEVADTLNRFDEIKRQSKDEKTRLREYYKEHIAGYENEDLRLGSTISDMIYKAWMKTNREDKLYDFADAYMEKVAKELNISINKANAAYELRCHMDTYSDWHKDVWGYRP